MDISTLIGGIHVMSSEEAQSRLRDKLASFQLAFDRYSRVNAQLSFEDYLSRFPLSLFSLYFGSDGLDRYYSSLLSALLQGQPEADVHLITILNYLIAQITYQGRYLHLITAEAMLLASGDVSTATIALANVGQVFSFSISLENYAAAVEVKKHVELFALSAREFIFGSDDAVTQSMERDNLKIGCIAFIDLAVDHGMEELPKLLSQVQGRTWQKTYYLFCGYADVVKLISEAVRLKYPTANINQIYYNSPKAGAELRKSILIVDGLSEPLLLEPIGVLSLEAYTVSDDAFVYEGKVDGVEVMYAHPTETVKVRAPFLLSSGAPLSDQQISTISNSLTISHAVAILHNGIVMTVPKHPDRSFIVANEHNEVIVSFMDRRSLAEMLNDSSKAKLPKLKEAYVSGRSILLSFSTEALNYHSHFLLQCYPRLKLAEALQLKDFKLLAASTIKKYQLEMLRLVGVRDEQIVIMDSDYKYVCEQVYVPRVNPAIFTPFLATIYDSLIASVGQVSIKPHKRILVSRAARTVWRNLANYDLICELLIREFGFELVEPDKLNIQDEIRLFQESAIVVGAEGAGLYNCCFMQSGTDVVALADQDYVMYVLGSMAEIRDFNVSYVFGESFQADSDLPRKLGHADFIVDPIRVKALVEELIRLRTIAH